MILIAMIVTAVLFFVAGMHYATWDQNRDDKDVSNSAWWSVALAFLGIYNMISLVGMASRV